MVRQIIILKEPVVTVNLPVSMVGKTVEVIAFEIDPEEFQKDFITKTERLKKIEELTGNSLVDLSNFRFNRNEANNYDD